MNEPIFNAQEREQPLFKKFMRLMDERLERLRKENDADSPEEATAKRRGRIAEIKHWQKYAEPPDPSKERAFTEEAAAGLGY